MMEKFNRAILETVLSSIPKSANPATVIADSLFMSKEAAYRRLRSEVPFSFSEAAVLSRQLNFSLDRILTLKIPGNVLFRLRFDDFNSPVEIYNGMLEQDIVCLRETAADPTAVFATATNAIPAEFYMRYDHLADFKLYKWLYQHGLVESSMRTFELMTIPDTLRRNCREYVASVRRLPASSYVFDDSGFEHWLNAVRAFRDMHLISDQSIAQIKEQLLLLLEEMEQVAMKGSYEEGDGRVSFYLSDVDIDATYTYLRSSKCRVAGIEIFSLNALRTVDDAMFDYMQRWIQTQSRFSTLISCSGEMRRIQYFMRQREIISRL